ncbi:MAG: very short patch repair endonuclease, partial [Candidatus Thalassarchaeaceae archaeon]
WHRCPKCSLGLPKTNTDYWMQKFERNTERDKRKESALMGLGWEVHTIWECELGSAEVLLPPLLE